MTRGQRTLAGRTGGIHNFGEIRQKTGMYILVLLRVFIRVRVLNHPVASLGFFSDPRRRFIGSSCAGGSPLGIIGRLLRRMPVASKIALPMAGATAMIGVSPAPAEGRSLRSSRVASISGRSRNRGTR